MSLILEALRKSEAERRRGLPPDVHAELPPAPARRTRATVPAWAWLALVIGLLALAAWLVARPDPSDPRPTTGTAGTTPLEDAQPLPARSPPAQGAAPAATLPRITPDPALPESDASPSSPPQASRMPAPPPMPPQAAPVAPARIEPPTPAPIPSPAAPRPPAGTEPGRVLALGELDAGTRDALPPLRMSMHLWNEEPAQRFAIIDGKRLREGDLIGEVRVVRIERDGVLLEWQGRGIRLPVR